MAKTEAAKATEALAAGDTDLKALRGAGTGKAGAQAERMPFDLSMALTDTLRATWETRPRLKSVRGMMQTADKRGALDVLRMASGDKNITAALLHDTASMGYLKQAANDPDGRQLCEANLALKSVEDSVILRTFGRDAIPQQGDIEQTLLLLPRPGNEPWLSCFRA